MSDPMLSCLEPIPNGWAAKKLTEVLFYQEGPGLTSDLFEDEGVPFLNIRCIDGKEIIKERCRFVNFNIALSRYRHFMLEAGDIVFSSSGTIGKIAFAKEEHLPLMLNTSIIRFRALNKDILAIDYIPVFLNSDDFIKQYTHQAQGSAQVNVGPTHLDKMYIALPPLPQQQKIAKILATVDNLIEQTQALIDKYTAIKQGMMADLFTRGIDLSGTPETNPNHGQLRPSFEEAPELYKETELGWVPREWEVTQLKNYLKNIEQGWSPDCESEPAIEGEWGVLKTTAVVWEGFSAEQNKALPKHLMPRPEYKVQHGDVLMTRAGPGNRVGVVAFVDKTQDKLMLSDKLYRIVPGTGLTSQYLALLLSSDSTQRQLNATKTGLAESQSNISQAIVSKLIVHIPSEVEQTWIVTKLSSVITKISSEVTLLKKLEQQKKGLMQDLLTGKVQVTA